MPLTVLVTGASGFVGRALLERLAQGEDYRGLAGVRDMPDQADETVRRLGDLAHLPADPTLLAGVDVLVHCAARVHVMREVSRDPLADFRAVNVRGSLQLARAAALAGVRRFVFLSTIKVHGETTDAGQPFTAESPLRPSDAYALSKQEAEQGLMQLASETGMEVVIVRPPLVYGPGVKGNFASMARLVERRLPLPLGAIHNRRSLVGIDNLVDLLVRCVDHPAAANQVFLAGDGEDLSTTELLRAVGKTMGRPARLIPVPAGLLCLGATLLGRHAMAQRLLGSLQVDISRTCKLLDWSPPCTVEEGLRRCFSQAN